MAKSLDPALCQALLELLSVVPESDNPANLVEGALQEGVRSRTLRVMALAYNMGVHAAASDVLRGAAVLASRAKSRSVELQAYLVGVEMRQRREGDGGP